MLSQGILQHYHRDQIIKIQSLTTYSVATVITPKEYILLYLRCTLEDIPSILMYLRERHIGVAVGVDESTARYSPTTNFIRLSRLSVANDPCMMLLTDSSFLNGEGGYGHVLSDSADNYVGCGYGPIVNIPVGLTLKEIVTLVELSTGRVLSYPL
ncbi:hypothetical protein POM88_033337 [Heracleum sosnowskyi]|uniref:Uncharacterized protein n=1 Tax=Heracleum sosnowskyi TaxID=360622 RepID=A0AAD8I297_9APIA|nr:hypothetical protein POM88_033337 [Heracleum sosnowskyi]